MRVLITGAAGFLGKELVKRFAADPDVVVRAHVRSPQAAGPLRELLGSVPGRHEIVAANLLKPADLAPLVADCDVVVHAAAGMRGAPADMYLNTVVATRNLLDATNASSARRVVLISSFAVYGTRELPSGGLVDETTPLEPRLDERDGYCVAKLHQEELAREYAAKAKWDLVVLRPGVIYGPGAAGISNRVGASMFGWFLHLGGSNLIPLAYITNVADATALAAREQGAANGTFNVHDDDLPTSRQFLRRYKREVGPMRSIWVPYPALWLISQAVQWYHRRSKGQLPAAFTPYFTASLYRKRRFSNARLKSLGWRPQVSTDEGLRRMFAQWRERQANAKR
jgi:nucleoside-diphosphate-sugar epimerase